MLLTSKQFPAQLSCLDFTHTLNHSKSLTSGGGFGSRLGRQANDIVFSYVWLLTFRRFEQALWRL